MENNNNNKRYKRFFFFILMMLIGIAAFSYIVMLLWNWLMPAIFSLPVITFWQAGGLLLLSKILFGSFNFNGRHKAMAYNNPALRAKMMNMTDEERKQFKVQWKERCAK